MLPSVRLTVLSLVDHLIHQTVRQCFLCSHAVVSVCVLHNLLIALAGILGKNFIEPFLGAHQVLGSQFNICRLTGQAIAADERIAKHKDWAMEIAAKNALTAENCMDILQQEVGKVFAAILEQCGVFDRNEAGKAQFLRFLSSIETA